MIPKNPFVRKGYTFVEMIVAICVMGVLFMTLAYFSTGIYPLITQKTLVYNYRTYKEIPSREGSVEAIKLNTRLLALLDQASIVYLVGAEGGAPEDLSMEIISQPVNEDRAWNLPVAKLENAFSNIFIGQNQRDFLNAELPGMLDPPGRGRYTVYLIDSFSKNGIIAVLQVRMEMNIRVNEDNWRLYSVSLQERNGASIGYACALPERFAQPADEVNAYTFWGGVQPNDPWNRFGTPIYRFTLPDPMQTGGQDNQSVPRYTYIRRALK